jgi:hypothetical protein
MYATILEKASRKIKKKGENNNNKGLGKVKNNSTCKSKRE